MENIDKKKIGEFIAELRKEKGLTQKQLAKDLFVSDKAVSKWETGQSIPDVQILIPLSEKLGVTVTEILQGEKSNINIKIDEVAVKQIITIANGEQKKETTQLRRLFVVCAIVAILEVFIIYKIDINLLYNYNFGFTSFVVAFFIGIYCCFFTKEVLPKYYDENQIDYYTDGFIRIHVPGVSFNNSNWIPILKYFRIWSSITMLVSPLMFFISNYSIIFMIPFFIALFVPIYYIANKY